MQQEGRDTGPGLIDMPEGSRSRPNGGHGSITTVCTTEPEVFVLVFVFCMVGMSVSVLACCFSSQSVGFT